ncbi:MAG: hypothetical protein PHO57_12210 [Acidithiobacillus sp.]|nr:hypothetical protein [Acidithiobacillus sp.]
MELQFLLGARQRDRRELTSAVASHRSDVMVMESTGSYWKIPYAALEADLAGVDPCDYLVDV